MIINPGLRWRIGGGQSFILTQLAGLGYAATGAWSVSRRMRQAYVGPLLRVRRSSDNAEQDVGFRSDGALDSATLVAFCAGGNGFVAKVYDQSGGGFDMAQATAGSQPRIVASGSLDTMGAQGRPTINFTSGTGSLTNATFVHGNAVTANIVAVSDGQSVATTSIIGSAAGTNGRVRIGGGGIALLGDATGVGTTFSAGVAMIVTGIAPGLGTVTALRRVNGAQDAAVSITRGAPAAGVSWGIHFPGGSGNFTGKCSEFVAFTAALNATAASILERDQGRHYGITVA